MFLHVTGKTFSVVLGKWCSQAKHTAEPKATFSQPCVTIYVYKKDLSYYLFVSFPNSVCYSMEELASMCVCNMHTCDFLLHTTVSGVQHSLHHWNPKGSYTNNITSRTFCKQANKHGEGICFLYFLCRKYQNYKKNYILLGCFSWKYFWFCPQTRAKQGNSVMKKW